LRGTNSHEQLCANDRDKTFPLRGIKDSPSCLHDGRLLTLEDTVDFFNLVVELKLAAQDRISSRSRWHLWRSARPRDPAAARPAV
jgi:hypothetical protein